MYEDILGSPTSISENEKEKRSNEYNILLQLLKKL